MQGLRIVVLLLLAGIYGCAQKSLPTEQSNNDVQSATTSSDNVNISASDVEQNLVDNAPLRRDWSVSELDQQIDLWSRMRQQMYLRIPEKPSIKRERAFYGDQQKFWRETVERAAPSMYHIVRRLEERQMPVELALLPVIESGYNPAAQGAGPAGLWQLVPGTARNFGLTVTSRYDARKDPIASTDATLDYLQHLYDTLGHDWLTAVAAYNTGEGRIQAAIERNQRQRKPIDFWSLKIPEKYIRTVPKWLAVIQLVHTPQKYGMQLPALPNQASTVLTTIRPEVSLRQTASISGVSYQEFKQLNPAFRTDVSPAGKAVPLLLPTTAFERYQQNQHQLVKTIDTTPAKAQLASSKSTVKQYKVKSGDSIKGIAKRFKMQAKTLRQLNKLTSDALKPGQMLVVQAEPSKASATRQTTVSKQTYQVQNGDSLDKIARKFKVKVADLVKWNQIKKNAPLQLGQQLVVKPAK